MSAPWIDASSFPRNTKVIAVVDVVESVRLMEQDEQEFIRRWQSFVEFVIGRLPGDTGRLHKSLGDGLMLEFCDPDGCLRSALAMQAWCNELNRLLPAGDQVHLRMGAHVAEFIADAHDIYGTDVNLAARIASLAAPGEIVISAALRDRLTPASKLVLEDLGTCHLKHVKEPVHAFRVGLPDAAPTPPVALHDTGALRPAIAVLPFGLRGAVVDGVTAEALADDIAAALSRSSLVQVVSRLATAGLREARATLEEVRQQGPAAYVLTGRAQRHQDHVSLYLELAEGDRGHVTWAQMFSGSVRELGAADGRLPNEVVTQVHAAVMAHETERALHRAPRGLPGHTLLLSAIALMHRLRPADIDQAEAMLGHLAERWPRHPGPHAWLAHLHALRVRLPAAGASGCKAGQLAIHHATTALRCDAGSPLALAMQGYALVHAARDLRAAGESYAQGLAANPRDPLLLLFQAELFALRGMHGPARDCARRALPGFPLEPVRYLHDGVSSLIALEAGEPQEALRLAESAVQRQPCDMQGRVLLGVAEVACGRLQDARETVARLVEMAPSFSLSSFLAHTPATPAIARRLADALARAGAPRD